jgi:hypothetical protein
MNLNKITIILLTILTACGHPYSSESQTDEKNEVLNESNKKIKKIVFQLIDSDINLSEVTGNIVDQQSWVDKTGTWHCLLTELIDVPNEFAEFRLYKFKEYHQGKPIEQQVYIDSTSCREADIVAESNTKKLIITDIDSNNKAEVSFAYTLSCTYDVSPQRRILIVNIDSSNHKLIGYTLGYSPVIPDTNDLNLKNYKKNKDGYWHLPIMAGRYESEDDFNQLPDNFLTHAKNTWLDILKVEYDIKQKEMNK